MANVKNMQVETQYTGGISIDQHNNRLVTHEQKDVGWYLNEI